MKHYAKLHDVVHWKNTAQKAGSDIQDTIKNLTSRIAVLEALAQAPNSVPPHEEEGQANGHGMSTNLQGRESKGKSLDPTMLKGEPPFSNKLFTAHDIPKASARQHSSSAQSYDPRQFKLPKIDFPRFEGEHPLVWRQKAEKYFRMYNVPVEVWVSFATINFKGNAELWLQSYEAQHSIGSWAELCVAIEQKFGRDLQHNYMKDILAIKQTSDVLEYAARYEQAKHRVLMHNRNMGGSVLCPEVYRWA
jgi:hypothetical protein